MKCVLRKFGWVLRPHAHTSFLCLALSSLRGKAEVFVVEATNLHLQIHNLAYLKFYYFVLTRFRKESWQSIISHTQDSPTLSLQGKAKTYKCEAFSPALAQIHNQAKIRFNNGILTSKIPHYGLPRKFFKFSRNDTKQTASSLRRLCLKCIICKDVAHTCKSIIQNLALNFVSIFSRFQKTHNTRKL
ncbi:hypothetical protein [Helicobacter rodentium]|uniref:hypothetical protein n=1 Tax=Helicobacter rodentium TaxID=59617 RepID=UPI00047B5830|nr:hypothetical protein [Helicobacter rodentium]